MTISPSPAVPADTQSSRRDTLPELPCPRTTREIPRWQQRFYRHVSNAAILLDEPDDPTLTRQAIINLKLAINLSDQQDLDPAQTAQRNRAARAFNNLIPLENILDFQPTPIMQE